MTETAAETVTETVKYVRLRGYAHIGVAVDGRLTLSMCDPMGKPYPVKRPIFFSFIPGTPEGWTPSFPENPPVVPPPVNPPIRFLKIDMYAQFTEDQFKLYDDLWKIIDPDLTWETAELPTPETMDDMNPTGPPRP
ncbi:hypothetical protein MUK70_15130 [Dyadobacter chenwenxiniae]|uniref:Uncharacterized protein n=1 Tax=Dyadobacter chenwenxiniae TaxID=2906456 RepID=A0A9X1PHU5_9BACT|nr:hypothetical protein [Dyadobacter chenwenxiniae]MCF0051625.1 hypothetical protein [Dyadobacter chenwenxiniae]MCF0060575.1 hypothetical protein [Dyadobacter chenwenxiniae]UON86306.1 hypothetical protein MUK70_15130 [Dyadobacter chenwenxiniae]